MTFSKTIACLLILLLPFPGISQADSAYIQEIQAYQSEQNHEFADPKESPLTDEDREEFKALDFYEIDKTFHIKAKFIRTENEKPFEMPTTTERKPVYVKYGEAHFNIGGKDLKLNLYQSLRVSKMEGFKDYLFLPFNDHTNGFGSYGGGRFMDVKIPKGDTIVLDFNKAYNPYCAYNHKYSCPIPPEENKLDVKILAGVKDFGKH